MSAAAKTKPATNTVYVYSILPHAWDVALSVKQGKPGEAGYHVSYRRVSFSPGDNRISADDWALIEKLPAVQHHLSEGNLSKGLISKASARIRALVWDGSSVDEQGRPKLTKADKGWIKLMSPKAQTVTDNFKHRAQERGVLILTDKEIADLNG